jgi:hypothetical protein
MKVKQLDNMGEIYANSALTIIDAASENSDGGLPGVGARPRRKQPSFKDDDCMPSGIRAVSESHLTAISPARTEIQSSRWSTRGWTLQEGLLGRRRLVFTPTQVYFHCTKSFREEWIEPSSIDQINRACEEQDDYLSGKDDTDVFYEKGRHFGLAFQRSFEDSYEWCGTEPHSQPTAATVINNFLHRSLTFESDAVNAMRGVLSHCMTQKLIKGTMCGLPIFDGYSGGGQP